MEMPENCFDCPFMYGRKYCLLDSKIEFNDPEYSELKNRYKGCPLIEVPEPHGRLGDLDALPWYLANTSVKYATYEDWEMLCDAITAAPTVIPASEEAE
jgi:hypothetical protein